jgi:MoaA/NifB/PqqE/SkfB family radical SAM enzyme
VEKLKRYVEIAVATENCNLRCSYCYITQQRKFNNKLVSFTRIPREIRQALSIRRLGGTCLLNFCAGGETLLAESIIPVIGELLDEGHYVTLVTNGTLAKRFDEIAALPGESLKRLFFKFSFHYQEFKRLNLFDIFFGNVEKMRNAGCSFTVELTPHDELIPHIGEIKEMCLNRLGALCHCTIARDNRTTGLEVLSKHDFGEYKRVWSSMESELFDFKAAIFYQKRKEFCYAGDWSVNLQIDTGDIYKCYGRCYLGNIYKDISQDIPFEAIGHNCPLPHCYNGHAFLTLGVIPELDTPTYAAIRNRVDALGREWLRPEWRAFIGQKLNENNDEYTDEQKKERTATKGLEIFAEKIFARVEKRLNNLGKRLWRRRIP